MGRQGPFRLQLLQGPPKNNRRQFNDVIELIYAPEESNIIPQCTAGPGGTRPDLHFVVSMLTLYALGGLSADRVP
jgi:hypothetical protein